MKNLTFATIIALTMTFSTTWAHEGHDHDAPKTIQAPKGGVLKGTESFNVEVVSKGKDLKVYFYDLEMKPKDIQNYKIDAKIELPRNKKTDTMTFKASSNFLEGSYDAKGAHRYTLILDVLAPEAGHPDTLKFTIEPRK
ncbi:hypothetical protein [Bdellovibrio sp.]|uniref:hypothetical protein n=1 Tax=Bdellovibrio sp. TaxID=28201 RepID=UPI0039E3BE18